MKRPRHLLNLTLSGLPELQYFESDEAREKALSEIGTEAGNPVQGSWWAAVGMIWGSIFVIYLGARWLLTWVVWPRWIEDALGMVLAGLTFLFVLRALHRSGAAGELREKLLVGGVPVCRGCGYLLKGLPLDPGRCPECGRTFDDDVRRILASPADAEKLTGD